MLDGAYGCFCNYFEGDRQFSQAGFGPRPVDSSDAVCKAHKDCLACVRDEFGDECIPEGEGMVFSHQSGQCTDDINTCKRALCECQKQAAIEQANVKHTRSDQWFMWFMNGGSDAFKTTVCRKFKTLSYFLNDFFSQFVCCQRPPFDDFNSRGGRRHAIFRS